jgi:hypothetical protein
VRHDGGDLRSRPVREVPGRPGSRSGGDGSNGAGGRKRGEALTHVPVIDRDPSGLYPLLVMPLEITPEPDEAERQAIVTALAAEEAEQLAASEWAAALLPARNDEEPEP